MHTSERAVKTSHFTHEALCAVENTPSNLYGVVGTLRAAWIIISVQAVQWNHKSDERAPTVTSWHKSSICQGVSEAFFQDNDAP